MFHIVTAMKEEAAPVLKLVSQDTDITVTGTGKVNAAFAVGRLYPKALTRKDADLDILINIGCCCSRNLKGMFIVNKITDISSGEDFYPDILRIKGIPEAPLLTSDTLVADPDPDILYDMEASALYKAACALLSPDRIIFIKIVSDGGDIEKLSSSYIKDLMMSYEEELNDAVLSIKESVSAKTSGPDIDGICSGLCATSSMRSQIEEIIRFADSLGIDGNKLFEEEITGKMTKVQGKRIISHVKAKLTS